MEVTLTIKPTNPIDLKKKIEKIQAIAKLDDEDLDRLAQIANNQKALKTLKDKWLMLKMMF